MNPDPVPPVRPLLTHVIPGELVQCEASVSIHVGLLDSVLQYETGQHKTRDSPQSSTLQRGVSNGLQETWSGEHVVNCQEKKCAKLVTKTKQNHRMGDE